MAVGSTALLAPLASSDAVTTASSTTYRTASPGPAVLPEATVSQWPRRITIGTSTNGRPLVAIRYGNPSAEKVLLTVGIIHGNEKKGGAIANRLRQRPPTTKGDYQIWVIPTMNPDGTARTRRHNARGVDLNRNFPYNWSRWTYAAGRAPGSEPETRAVVNLIDRLRPDGTLIFHQDWNVVLGTCNSKTRSYAYQFAALSRIPPERCQRAYTGTMGTWQNTLYPGYALTVELPGSRFINRGRINKYRNAVVATARKLPDLDTTSVLPQSEPEPTEPEPEESESVTP